MVKIIRLLQVGLLIIRASWPESGVYDAWFIVRV